MNQQSDIPFPEPQEPEDRAGVLEREGWTQVACVGDLPERGGHPCKHGDEEIALFRTRTGVACVQDFCQHRGANLSDGHVDEDEVICPWHGWRYRLSDGECTTLPGSAPVPCYETRIVDEAIWVRKR